MQSRSPRPWLRAGVIACALALAAIGLVRFLRAPSTDRAEPPAASTPTRPQPLAENAPAPQAPIERQELDEAVAPAAADTVTEQTTEPTREFLRTAIAGFLAQHAGGRQLSSGELESLIDSMLHARAIYEEIAALDDTPANAARIASLREEAARAGEDARQIAGFDSSLFGLVGALGRSAPQEQQP